ncbi:MAG: UDP-N-acetylglucosamine 2-epimerase (hydrolyzing) [Idiomarinaceae bacterium]|uniref:UDP-N-acetylglucosamine 2-epimerase n=1 Tax=Idiomarina sp. 28-8 TaxID=1260624 RepID=UPI0002DDD818|nr:UDP-N-acetylglucosamine 2-epimerase [Idiomarina sp. 28-8]NWO02289.1 UDP-N-acetylglucosamine 2-epimerase (hydrolyzing) [Idiomarinaceae bacterium]
MKRKVAVFTGTRAEYGLLYWVIKGLEESSKADLLLFAGGMHLSPEFGKTINQIENDGFKVTEQLEFLLSSDSPVGIAKSMGLAMISAADAFQRTKPDMLVVLGDRYEALAVCQAAMIAQIPIVHIHGGETTEGLIDEAVRHSITKMSHLHFTATEDYRKRVIQLGEPPAMVYNFGAPGVDSIKNLKLLERNELSDAIEFNVLDTPFMVVTYHPVTLNKDGAIDDFTNLLSTLEKYENFKFIITYPNADTFGRSLITLLQEFKEKHPDKVLLTKSLGQLRYLSVLKNSELTIGNSSSGLIEAPSFGIPTVNIGRRQRGRVAGDTVINCDGDAESIKRSLDKALSSSFKKLCAQSKNPYGDGNSSKKIIDTLLSTELDNLVYKKFYDLI